MISCSCKTVYNINHESDRTVFIHTVETVGAQAMIRGVRNGSDYTEEETLAQLNTILVSTLDTVLINAPDALSKISSTMVKQVANYKDWPIIYERWDEAVAKFVSPAVVKMLKTAHQKSLRVKATLPSK